MWKGIGIILDDLTLFDTMKDVCPAYISFDHLLGTMIGLLYFTRRCQFSDFINRHKETFFIVQF